jgi:N-acetylmuramoyl-L-alanine amidase
MLLLAVLLGSPPPAAADLSRETVAKQYQQAVAYYHNLTANSVRAGERENWRTGIRSFQRIVRAHPAHELAPSCLFMLGRLHHDLYRRFANPLDLGEAVAYFQDIVLLFPDHRLADDALFKMAEIYLKDKKEKDEAARTFARIIAVYPGGDMARAAAGKLSELKSRGALPAAEPEPIVPVLTAAAVKKSEAGAAPVRIQPLRYWSNNDYTRVVIETDAPVTYEHSMLPRNGNQPRRLYVDLQNCRLKPGTEGAVDISDGLLKQVRTGQHAASTVRVVLDIESIVDYKIFNLQEPFRVVIDAMGRQQPGPAAASVAPAGSLAPSLAQQLGLGIKKIVLDPGHGGKDPGAIGPNGIKEKDIVLAVAKRVARHLERELGCQVIFTRDRDVFIPLEERTAIANTSGADLFISIHANAAPSANVRGVETYFLDLATNKEAMRVAARENATSARQLSDLQSILMDLMQNTKVHESAKLAEFVQASMISGLGRSYRNIVDLGVKRAPFVVLIGAQMPAVLTEIAFLSNPEEARWLCDPGYQQEVAVQIVAGVSQYVTDLNLAGLKLD